MYFRGEITFSVPFSDLGVHVDGFISNVAHSLVVGVTKVCRHCRGQIL